MRSTSKEQTSINLTELDEEANGDMEMGNIRDTLEFLLNSKQNHCNKKTPSIQKIPNRIRELKEKAFEPRQVSIGPLHRLNENLKAFEGQKAIFMHDLLDRSGLPIEETLESIVRKVNASIGKIKECYGDEIKYYNDDQIIRMMVMDGCFILEFIWRLYMGNFDGKMAIESFSMVFDLVLIENQIPFFVLQDIFECTSSRFKIRTSVDELIIHGLVPVLGPFNLNCRIVKNGDSNKTDHILGFIHECYKRPLHDEYQWQDLNEDIDKYQSIEGDDSIIRSPYMPFYSAVELDRAGMNFKPHYYHELEDEKWSMDIELKLPLCSWCRPWARPTLKMPVMSIHNFTELVFWNLIAYEQLSSTWDYHYFASYAIALDRLIDNHEDVAILVKSKILFNSIGSNEEAAKVINDMCKGIYCSRFYYYKEWKGMNEFHNRIWPRNIASLRRTYFSNPWNMIALLAGMLLFGFTVVQTYYTVNPA